MTVIKKAGTIETLVYGVINNLSPIDIMDATGKTVDLFYKVANLNQNSELSLKDAVKLDEKLVEIGKDAVFFRHYQIAMRGKTSGKGSVEARLIALIKETGDVAALMKDGDIDKDKFLKESYEILDAAQNMINTIEGE